MIEKIRKSVWIDWIIAVLGAIIISYLMSKLGRIFTSGINPAWFIPHPYPAVQMVGFETIRSINVFSGEGTDLMDHWQRLTNVAVSFVFMFIISPWLFIKGTKQSQEHNKTTVLWYVGAACMFVVTILPLITNFVTASVFIDTKERASISASEEQLRTELIYSAFKTSKTVINLEDISEMENLKVDQLFEPVKESYNYFVSVSVEDSLINLAIISDVDSWNEEFKNLNGGKGKVQASITVYPYREDLFAMNLRPIDVEWRQID